MVNMLTTLKVLICSSAVSLTCIFAQDPAQCAARIPISGYTCLFDVDYDLCRCFKMDMAATRDWDHADSACKASGPSVGSSRLAVDDTDQTHELIVQLVTAAGARVVWLNSEYIPQYWSWIFSYNGLFGSKIIYYQGCYERVTGDFDVFIPSITTVEQCRTACGAMYSYFTVRQKQGSNVPCYCSRSFSTTRIHGTCLPCSHQTNTWCGDSNSDAIYATNTEEQYDIWNNGQPVGLGNSTDSSYCIACIFNASTQRLEWSNQPCSDVKNIICIRDPAASNPPCHLDSPSTGLCYIRSGTGTWLNGLSTCAASSMTMVSVVNKMVEDDLIAMGTTSLWLAGTSNRWLWNTETPSEMYTNHWRRGTQPQGNGRSCVALLSGGSGFTWQPFPCAPRPANFLCETVISIATDAPTTTSSDPTTVTSTTSANPTTEADEQTTSTETTAPPPVQGYHWATILGITVVSLLIILVVCLIFYLLCCKMRQRRNDDPEKDDTMVTSEVVPATSYAPRVGAQSPPNYAAPPVPQRNSPRTPRMSKYIKKQTISEVDGRPQRYQNSSEETSETDSETSGYETPVNPEKNRKQSQRPQQQAQKELSGYRPRSERDPYGDTKDNSVQLHVILRHDIEKTRPTDKQGRISYETRAENNNIKSELSDNVTVLHLPTLPELPDVTRDLNGRIKMDETEKKSPTKRRKRRSRHPKIQPSDSTE